jgi:hypothetical protein
MLGQLLVVEATHAPAQNHVRFVRRNLDSAQRVSSCLSQRGTDMTG